MEIFATHEFFGSWMRTPTIAASGQDQPFSDCRLRLLLAVPKLSMMAGVIASSTAYAAYLDWILSLPF